MCVCVCACGCECVCACVCVVCVRLQVVDPLRVQELQMSGRGVPTGTRRLWIQVAPDDCGSTREIHKVRFVTNFEYVPQVLTPICPYHQKEKAPKIISISCQN